MAKSDSKENLAYFTPRDAVIALMKGVAPERQREIGDLWDRYNPEVEVAPAGAKKLTLQASGKRIVFDLKTIDVFWLIAFSGWKAIETYMPHVWLAAQFDQRVGDVIRADPQLDEFERDYKERIQSVQAWIEAADSSAAWPSDLPRPSADRNAVDDVQYKAAFDLTQIATAFTLLHEFRHVMLDQDTQRNSDRREEEISCDVWARSFITDRLGEYANATKQPYAKVLRLRSMGIALAALILHEITPVWDRGGNQEYFSLQTRLVAALENTQLPDDDSFWVFSAALLIGMLRQKRVPIDAPAMSARALARHLIDLL